MDQGWFERIQQGFAANMAETRSQPANRGYDALRWAILGDTPLRKALSVDPPEMISKVTRADVLEWHRQTVVRTGAEVVIAGEISQEDSGKALDALLVGLPDGIAADAITPNADFTPRRILLHIPEAQTSTLVFMGSLPPTVMRDMPVSRAISRIDSFCRKCLRRMMFNSPMSITQLPRRSPLGEGSHGSNLNENSMPTPVSFG
jgi:predicted Zn-dependent peptidase